MKLATRADLGILRTSHRIGPLTPETFFNVRKSSSLTDSNKMADVLRVVVSGAAGQIAYALLYSIAKGDVFGPSQRIDLVLLDIQPMVPILEGVVMELQDCSLPLVRSLIPSADAAESFKDADAAILVGAMPRKPGMERKDLLKANAKIFQAQGKAMDENAKKDIKVLVVGNPANTNCLIAQRCAPSIPKENFTCLTRLDQNRAQAQIANRLGVATDKVCDVTIWGNHSTTQYPDAVHAKVEKDGALVPVFDAVKDDAWLTGDFITTVQKRGAAVLAARKLSSAMSAAKAICDHMRDWWFGTKGERWVSMGVFSDGKSYGIPEGVIYSFPVCIKDRKWTIVQGLDINPFSRGKMDESAKELVSERDMAFEHLGQ